MVTLHSATKYTPIHRLRCNVSNGVYKKGDVIEVFIAKYACGRFAIMDANFGKETTLYEVHSEQSLHENFQEVD